MAKLGLGWHEACGGLGHVVSWGRGFSPAYMSEIFLAPLC